MEPSCSFGLISSRALIDPNERVIVRPDDIVMLQFKKSEAVTNFLSEFLQL